MRIPRIYSPQALSPSSTLELEEGASHHLLKVLRMTPGRELIIFNGQGGEYRATISSATKKTATLAVGEHNAVERESPLFTELAISVSKGDRFDWVLQKATELGVSRFIPLFTERSEVRLSGERLEKKVNQWQKIIIGACEQCQRNRLPELISPQSLTDYADTCRSEQRYVLHHRSDQKPSAGSTPASVALLIGPEGGLSDSEIREAQQQGFSPLTLGPRVLRTETAPIAALCLVQSLWGDF